MTLYIVVPCYNEEEVLPLMAELLLKKLNELIDNGIADGESRLLFVNDGSTDSTWEKIKYFSETNCHVKGISLSRNSGQQNAILAGLMEAKSSCDAAISIDCDGQDDVNSISDMIREYKSGADIVYGVRSNRDKDSFFKRASANGFYSLLKGVNAKSVKNHADYRLVSRRVLDELANFREVNVFLRGMLPLVGFRSTCVYYERKKRLAGKSHYSLRKMLSLAIDGITSFSAKPIRAISLLGIIAVLIGLVGFILSVTAFSAQENSEFIGILFAILLIGGIQLICIGIIGEYIGKIYLETKSRPRYIIEKKTDKLKELHK